MKRNKDEIILEIEYLILEFKKMKPNVKFDFTSYELIRIIQYLELAKEFIKVNEKNISR